VLDVNDTPPKFSRSRYSSVVPENSVEGTLVVQVVASDPDLGPSGEVVYDFADSKTKVRNIYSLLVHLFENQVYFFDDLETRLKDVRQYNIITKRMIYKCIDEIGGYAYSKASFFPILYVGRDFTIYDIFNLS
jgi:hypothetical protein